MEMLDVVKMLLGIADTSQDDLLKLYITITTQRIINYCNIQKLPEELEYTAAQMVVDMYNDAQLTALVLAALKSQSESSEESITAGTGNISSVSEDGRSISFETTAQKTSSTVSSASKMLQMFADDRISKIRELNRYKNLYRMSGT